MLRYQGSMQEPSLRTSRLALAGGIASAIAFGVSGFLIGRMTTEKSPASVPPPAVSTRETPASSAVIAPAVLGRADLIALAAAAADAATGGTDATDRLSSTVGRRFELRLPFGCRGPTDKDDKSSLRWDYDPTSSTLRVQVAPVVWDAADWWSQDPPAEVAAIEGFWIDRPWTASEVCSNGPLPIMTAGLQPAQEETPTLALGQIFRPDSPRRALRGDQPYRVTQRIAADQLDVSKGFRLRLSGRMAAVPATNAPVRCQQLAGPDRKPTCLIGVILDQVAIETGAAGATIATWDVPASDMVTSSLSS